MDGVLDAFAGAKCYYGRRDRVKISADDDACDDVCRPYAVKDDHRESPQPL